MGDLTDYEINKRLAEIAQVFAYSNEATEEGSTALYFYGGTEWSPLTDWSQLAPLMERFMFDAERHSDAHDSIWTVTAQSMPGSPMVRATAETLKRAICLAIIAAHQPDAGEGGA